MNRAGLVCRDDFQPGIISARFISRAGPVCREDFQPVFSTNDLDHLFPAIWWLIFCTFAAGWVTLPLHPI